DTQAADSPSDQSQLTCSGSDVVRAVVPVAPGAPRLRRDPRPFWFEVRRPAVQNRAPTSSRVPPMTMARVDLTQRNRLKALISAKSLIPGGDFKLASGGKPRMFFDMKMTLLDPEGLNPVADPMLQHVENEPFDAVGGLVLGACPIVDAIT